MPTAAQKEAVRRAGYEAAHAAAAAARLDPYPVYVTEAEIGGGAGVLSVNGRAGVVTGLAEQTALDAEVSRATTAEAGRLPVAGDITKTGVMTFSSSPIVPTPTTDTQAATKAYVDTLSALIVIDAGAAGGTNDMTSLNAKLAANAGRTVRGRPGSTYRISAPLVVPTGTTLDMTGCTVLLLAGSLCNMVNNGAVAPLRSVNDGVTTLGAPTTVSSATAAFTSADIGRTLSVVDAGPVAAVGGAGVSWYYGAITAQAATSATVSRAVTAAVTGKTLSVYGRDANVKIIGGTWDSGSNYAAVGVNQHIIRLRRITGLTVRDVNVVGAGMSQGSGGYFGIEIADVTDFLIDKIQANGNGDGVHVTGPCSRGRITNVSGRTNDDLVGVVAVGGGVYGDCDGDVLDVTVDGVYCDSAWRGVRMFSGTGTKLERCSARNVFGTTWQGAVAVGGSWYGPSPVDLEIENVSVTTQAGWSTVQIDNAPDSRVGLKNIKWPPSAGAVPARGVVDLDFIAGVGASVPTKDIREMQVAVSSPGIYTVNGPTVSIDIAKVLLPVDGDVVLNTNAALSCGAGPVMFNTAAGQWKHLWTGLTYTIPVWPPVGGAWPGVVGALGYILFSWSNAVGFYAVGTGDVVSLPAGATRAVTGASGNNTDTAATDSPPANALKNAAGTQGAQGVLLGNAAVPLVITFTFANAFNGVISAYAWDRQSGVMMTFSDGTKSYAHGAGTWGAAGNGQWSRWRRKVPAGGTVALTALRGATGGNVGIAGVFFD